MPARLTPRIAYAVLFAVCVGLLAYALYLQNYQGQDPCPLCILQRVAYTGLAAVFLAGALHGPGRTGAFAYSGAAVLVAAAGIAVAGRHVWLQHLPKDQVPACGPGLDYMLNKFPLAQVLQKVFAGSGQCAEATWRMLGLSIAEWSLVWLIVLGVAAAAVAIRAPAR